MVAEYLVQSLKDNLDDLEDKYSELNKEYKRSYRECDLLQRSHARIKKEYQILQHSLKGKCELVEKNGLTISNHLEQIKSNYNRNESNGRPSSNQDTVSVNNPKVANEIKLNGYHKEPKNSSPNSLNGLDSSLNNTNSSPNYKLTKCNGQLDDSPNANGLTSEQLTNGFIKSSLPNGLNSSISSAYHSSTLPNNCLNKDHKRHTDLSSCSSLSSTNDKTSCSSSSLIFSEEVYQFLTYVEGKTLNDKISYLLHDKVKQIQRIKALKSSLDDQKIKSIKLESLSLINGKQLNGDLHRHFNQSKFLLVFWSSNLQMSLNHVPLSPDDDGKKTIESYKKELELLAKQMEQLSENKAQIDTEIKHLQTRLDTMEKTENELKAEKRQLLRKVSPGF